MTSICRVLLLRRGLSFNTYN
ncbi:protein of unknown function [Pararobbsia alpina]